MRQPVVSIVMPTFNRLGYIIETVRSVQAQTFVDWELIVVDDGSTDETLAALAALDDPRIRCFALPHTGHLARLHNFGIRQAEGTYVAFQDSDDVWLPHKLALQLQRLRERPGFRWSYTSFQLIDAAGAPYPTADPHFGCVRGTSDGLYRRLLAHEEIIVTPSLVIERALLDEVGGLDDSLPRMSDFDLVVRLARASAPVAIEEPLVLVRRKPGRASTEVWVQVAEGLVRIFEAQLRDAGDDDIRARCRRQLARHSLDLADAFLRGRRLADGLRALGTAIRAGASPLKAFRVVALAVVRPLARVLLLRPVRSAGSY